MLQLPLPALFNQPRLQSTASSRGSFIPGQATSHVCTTPAATHAGQHTIITTTIITITTASNPTELEHHRAGCNSKAAAAVTAAATPWTPINVLFFVRK